jgi:hypothetical protein
MKNALKLMMLMLISSWIPFLFVTEDRERRAGRSDK